MNRTSEAKDILKRLIAGFKRDDVPALGAQLTYYLILSFFPFLIFLVSILSYVQLSGDDFISNLIQILPASSGELVGDILFEVIQSRSGALLSFGMLASIWAASNGINAVIKGVNKAYGEEENRPFWKLRGISVLATLVLAIVILLAMFMLVFGRMLGQYVFAWLGYPDGFEWIWNVMKTVVPLLIMFGVFLLLYRVTPNRRLSWREVVPGSLFTTIGWIITSAGFAFYVNNFGNYSKTYGSLGGIMILLIWLYISSIIIISGGLLNAVMADRITTVRK